MFSEKLIWELIFPSLFSLVLVALNNQEALVHFD
jgi:hypothetical protein